MVVSQLAQFCENIQRKPHLDCLFLTFRLHVPRISLQQIYVKMATICYTCHYLATFLIGAYNTCLCFTPWWGSVKQWYGGL